MEWPSVSGYRVTSQVMERRKVRPGHKCPGTLWKLLTTVRSRSIMRSRYSHWIEERNMNRLQKLLITLAVLSVIAAINSGSYYREVQNKKKKQAEMAKMSASHPEGGMKPLTSIDPVGSDAALVKIEAFVEPGNHCHLQTIQVLKEAAEVLPAKIHVKFYSTGSPEGAKAAEKAKIGCATGIIINGKKEFDVKRGGKPSKVTFHGPLNMMPPDSLPLVLSGELRNAYGSHLNSQDLSKVTTVIKKELATSEGAGMGGPEGKAGGKMGPGHEHEHVQPRSDPIPPYLKARAPSGKSV